MPLNAAVFPNGCGISLCRELLASPPASVLFFFRHGSNTSRGSAFQAGAQEYIIKLN